MDHGFAVSDSSRRFRLCIKPRNKESCNQRPKPGSREIKIADPGADPGADPVPSSAVPCNPHLTCKELPPSGAQWKQASNHLAGSHAPAIESVCQKHTQMTQKH